jgi:N-methylhydantoinase B
MKRKSVDLFTLEIIQESLIASAEEMFLAFGRTSKSPVIYEVLDYACGITDSQGQLIAQAAGVPGFLGTLDLAAKQVVGKYPAKEIEPGDVFITNDPYGNGTHLNDVTLLRPIFFEDSLVGFAVNKGHWTDVGGMRFGSWTSDSTEIFQEGLFFPTIKLYRRGKPNEDLLELIRRNVRMPEMSLGDMYAQEASLRVAARRVEELCAKYGMHAIQQAIRKILVSGERVTSQALRRLPHGTFEAEDSIDDDGMHDSPIPVRVKVKITPKKFVVDLRGSSLQVPGPINVSYPAALCMAKASFKAITSPQAPTNEGNFRAVELLTDLRSIFHPLPPAPVSTYWESGMYVADLIMKALAPHLPNRLGAGHFLSVCATILGGVDERTGQTFGIVEPQPGGWGGSAAKDGESGQFCVGDGETFGMSNEVIEARYPIRVEQYALNIAGGVGAGKRRGGFGLIKDYRILSKEAVFTASFGRSKFPPWGLAGGRPGTPNSFLIFRQGKAPERHGKIAAARLERGDMVRLLTGGGGGYGLPRDREPERVRNDVREGYLTIEEAREVYGIEIDSKQYVSGHSIKAQSD